LNVAGKVVIRAEGLGKKYVIGHQATRERYVVLRDVIARKAQRFARSSLDFVRGRGVSPSSITEEFWALREVSFEVRRGEVVGVIGRNGAGKSTLLKILSRITEPSEGRVSIEGRVASLLEVGTGFHSELTGRENIFLNGAILGMTRAEIRRKFDQIVAFAEVERFLDTPVKRYSSGMYVRLAFAVAAYLESDILIVDEVLAVGDAAFQKKCIGQMGDVSASGRTVLFVTHNIGSLLSICQTGMLLQDGTLAASGEIHAVAKAYQRLSETDPSTITDRAFHGPLKDLRFHQIELNGRPLSGQSSALPSEELQFCVRGTSKKTLPNFRFAFSLFREGVRVFTVHDGPEVLPEGPFATSVKLPARLLRPGDYFVSLGGRRVDGDDWVWGTDVATVTIMEEWGEDYDRDDVGLINLPGSMFRAAPANLTIANRYAPSGACMKLLKS
jgi:lipopolysaccharide transport system ATP-binding protein